MKLHEAKNYIESLLIENHLTKEKIKDIIEEFESDYRNKEVFFTKFWLDWKSKKILDDLGVKK